MNGPDQGLARTQRLTRSADFQAAFESGIKAVGQRMVLYLLPRPEGRLRLGVVSSRKLGGAVARNRARRLLREAYRRNRYRMRGAADVVLVARPALLAATWNEIENELLDLARRSGILGEEKAS
jgi:ribonuclease P protein component